MDTMRSASPDGDATQPQATLPQMLSHAAFISRDTAATVEFFTKVLGMEFVAAVLNDQIPSTGETVPYFHSFFRMADGSTIAYFEAPDLPPIPDPPHPAYDTNQPASQSQFFSTLSHEPCSQSPTEQSMPNQPASQSHFFSA
jgi:hypothetical protein